MILRTIAVALFLAAGHALAGAIGWGLVHVPESNVAMIALSAFLTVAVVLVVGLVQLLGCLSWAGQEKPAERVKRAFAALPVFLLAGLLFVAVWWVAGQAVEWLTGVRGEIDAAVMAQTGATRTAWVHALVDRLGWFARYGIGMSLALTLMATGAIHGARALLRPGWIGRGLAPLQLVLVPSLVFGLVIFPWQAAYWRPQALPANWLEPVFVAAKLSGLYLLANLGWATVLRTVTLRARGRD